MTAMAIGIVAVGWLSGLRFRGWRVSAWCVGVATILYGLISTRVSRSRRVRGNPLGASIATAGGLVFIAAAEWEAPPAGLVESEGLMKAITHTRTASGLRRTRNAG